jgi:hypothetical protein
MKDLPIDNVSDAAIHHIRGTFGWHGGDGDPPKNDDIIAVVRGYLEFLEAHPEERENWNQKLDRTVVAS